MISIILPNYTCLGGFFVFVVSVVGIFACCCSPESIGASIFTTLYEILFIFTK